jgi:hypothetical protein
VPSKGRASLRLSPKHASVLACGGMAIEGGATTVERSRAWRQCNSQLLGYHGRTSACRVSPLHGDRDPTALNTRSAHVQNVLSGGSWYVAEPVAGNDRGSCARHVKRCTLHPFARGVVGNNNGDRQRQRAWEGQAISASTTAARSKSDAQSTESGDLKQTRRKSQSSPSSVEYPGQRRPRIPRQRTTT